MAKKEAVVTELNLFRNGPQHNQLYSVSDLLYGLPSCATWIADYRWTGEVVYGSESGRPARVWVHVSSL